MSWYKSRNKFMDSRIKALEDHLIPEPPPFLLVCDGDDLQEKALQFKDEYPGKDMPPFLIMTRRPKLRDYCEGE
jgi:hypothetical protein